MGLAHEHGRRGASRVAVPGVAVVGRGFVPLLGPAYSRAREYTCDLCGHAVVNNVEVSSRALAILAAGGHAGRKVNLDLFVEQAADTGRFWMAIFELNATHPFLSKRVAAIRAAKGMTTQAPASRPLLAYPLAPILGVAGGGPILIVVIVTYAAILGAMPMLKKYFPKSPERSSAALVEPEAAPTLTRALEAGHPVEAEAGGIAADSLAPKKVGELMFPLAQRYVERVLLVSDEAIGAAQRCLWETLRVVVEAGAAAPFAALLSGAYQPREGERVGLVLSGANTTAVNFAPDENERRGL